MRRVALALLVAASAAPAVVPADEPVDLAVVGRIRDEGFKRSRVMETLAQLTDVIGPRLTGSPQYRVAHEWTRDELERWGLVNAQLEEWGPFGEGWSLESVSVRLVAPRTAVLHALPKAWTPGTPGPVRGELKRVKLAEEADFDKQRGQLGGKVLLLDEPRPVKPQEKRFLERLSPDELAKLAEFEMPSGERERWRREAAKRRQLQQKLNAFLAEEGVLATVEISSRDHGIVRVMGGGSREPGESKGVPALVMAAEQYNMLVRLADKGGAELELAVDARFHPAGMGLNTVAELPGSDRSGELVMLGGHLDSWHAGTGTTDDAAGCAVMMEAVRILKALDLHPKRTIRVALWGGEEQGLLGSRAYVQRHFASRPEPTDPELRKQPEFTWPTAGRPLTLKPEHARLAAYFNLDNGTGKVRGVYLQENAAVAPIFRAWLEPFHDLGATTLTMRTTGGTDHLPFDAVGLPGFQFIQDDVEYSTKTHHSELDLYDAAQADDLKQAAVVIASFAWHAANRSERLPRKALPKDEDEPAAQPTPSPAPSPAAAATGRP